MTLAPAKMHNVGCESPVCCCRLARRWNRTKQEHWSRGKTPWLPAGVAISGYSALPENVASSLLNLRHGAEKPQRRQARRERINVILMNWNR
jgi:hypothetical protein